MAAPSSACVPTTMSIEPSATPFLSRRVLWPPPCARPAARRLAPGEALREGLEILARQQRRRHHDGDLKASHGGEEGGAQRHLRLAEADVAADQPVHRPAGRKIVHDGVDGRLLVVRLLIGEAGGELAIDALGRIEDGASRICRSAAMRMSWPAMSRSASSPRLARLPGAAAELIERRLAESDPNRDKARCSRRAGTAGRRRHSGSRGNHAARRAPRWCAARRSARCRDLRGRRYRRRQRTRLLQ